MSSIQELPINGSIESLLAPTRPPRSQQDTRIRDLAIEVLASEFEKVPDISLEKRVYLIETTFPAVVVSLEKLLTELERGGARVVRDDSGLDIIENSKKFDSLNWLAQHLFRNNPGYTSLNDATTSSRTYVKSLQSVSKTLKQRILDVAAFKEAQRIAAEKATREAIEREEQARRVKLEETKRVFTELLSSTFKMWVSSIRRKSPGYLYRAEIMNTYRTISDTDDVMADTDLYNRVKQLLFTLEHPTEDSSADTYNSNDSLASVTLLSFEKWDLDAFVKTHMHLTLSWSLNELSSFLQILSSEIASVAKSYESILKEHFFVPKFKNVEVIQDWLESLFPLIQTLVIEDHADGENIVKACRDFCRGKEDTRYSSPPREGEDDDNVAQDQALDETTSLAESAYRSFMKSLLGEYGPDVFIHVMIHIRQEYDIVQAELAAQERVKPVEPIVATVQSGNGAIYLSLQKLLFQIYPEESQADHFLSGPLLKLVALVGKDSSIEKGVQDALQLLESYLSSVSTFSISDLESKLQENGSLDTNLIAIQILSQHIFVLEGNLSPQQNLTDEKSSNPRYVVEEKALNQIRSLALPYTETPHVTLNNYLTILSNAFSEIYSTDKVSGRISLMERAASRLKDATSKLSADDTFADKAVMESFLRVVACSSSVKEALWGKTFDQGTIIDFQIIESKQPLLTQDVSSFPLLNDDPLVKAMSAGSPEELKFDFLGTPIASSNGVISFAIAGGHSGPDDSSFLGKAALELNTLLTRIHHNQDLIALISSAKLYTQDSLQATTKAILIQSKDQLFEITDDFEADKGVQSSDMRSFLSSPYLAPPRYNLTALLDASNELQQSIDEVRDLNSSKDYIKDNLCYIPFWDSVSHTLVALLVVEMKAADEESSAEVKRLADIVSSAASDALNNSGKDSKGEIVSLEAENIDELGRRQLTFGKLVLHFTRERIMKLDARAIAELKSYKKPPLSVHRLMKGVLYLFGKKPKEVKAWADTIKFISMDLLKQIWSYDPTGVHKKLRWKRMKKVLKHTKDKPDSPSECLFDWLHSALVLREEAIAIRKARPDLFDRSSLSSADSVGTSTSSEGGNDDEEGDEEEDQPVEASSGDDPEPNAEPVNDENQLSAPASDESNEQDL